MEKVLIEMGTATWNNACANEVLILEELKNQGLEIAVVNYHLNDPFANQYSNDRASYYNIQSVPYPIIHGSHIINGDIQNYMNAYEVAINTNASFVISADGSFLGDTLFIEVVVQKIADYESDEIKLHLALNESNIVYEWLQHDDVDDVERKMSPDAEGSDLDFSNSDTETIYLEAVIEENWNPAEMELIAFIQNDTSKQVLQCHSVAFTEFSPLPVHAFFQADDTVVCRKQFVAFDNYSTGDVESIEWFFEGGIPEISTEEFPEVKYNEAGAFDVRLIVSNSISLDTTLKENYIEVKELPAIGFAPIPDFCHDDPPYELTEGWPEEGNYFGLFVDTGYFHPMTAGPGTYTVYFAYQDEDTMCSDTLSQTAIVDLCNTVKDIGDSKGVIWFWEGQQIRVKFREDLYSSKKQILLYNTLGQLIKESSFKNNNEFFIDIPPQSKSLILVVKTDKGVDSFKVFR